MSQQPTEGQNLTTYCWLQIHLSGNRPSIKDQDDMVSSRITQFLFPQKFSYQFYNSKHSSSTQGHTLSTNGWPLVYLFADRGEQSSSQFSGDQHIDFQAFFLFYRVELLLPPPISIQIPHDTILTPIPYPGQKLFFHQEWTKFASHNITSNQDTLNHVNTGPGLSKFIISLI